MIPRHEKRGKIEIIPDVSLQSYSEIVDVQFYKIPIYKQLRNAINENETLGTGTWITPKQIDIIFTPITCIDCFHFEHYQMITITKLYISSIQ